MLLVFSFTAFKIAAQTGNYTLKHYNTENGLPQNSVLDVAVDKYGFVWLGTENGLVRFDGQNFRVFKQDNTPALKTTDRVRYLFANENGHIYFATGDMFTYEINNINNIAQIGQADEYLITQNKGALPFKETLQAFKQSRAIFSVWDSTFDGALRSQIIKLSGQEFYFLTDSVRYIKKGQQAISLCTTFNTVVSKNTVYHFNLNGTISTWYNNTLQQKITLGGAILSDSLYKQNVEKLELVTGKNIFVAKLRNNYYSIKRNGNVLETKILFKNLQLPLYKALIYDGQHDQYFVCTIADGFYVLKASGFTSVLEQLENNVSFRNAASSQLVLPGDSILLNRNILFDKNGKQKKGGRYWGNPGVNDENGSFWYSMDAEMIEKLDSKLQPLLQIKGNRWGTMFCRDTITKQVWFAAEHAIYRINQSEKKLEPLKLPLLEKERIWHLSIQSENKLWVGTGNGLYILNFKTLQFQKIKNSDGKTVRNVLNDAENDIAWVGTYGSGPCYVKNGQLFRLPLDKEQNLLYAHYFFKDRKGFMWIPTNKGLYQAAVKDLLGYTANATSKIYYQNYSTNNGFASNEFNGGYTAPWVLRKDGVLSLCSMKGLVWFTPENIAPELPNQPIFIDEITVDGKDTILTTALKLSPNYTQFSVSVATPYFGNKENVHLEYQIVGFNEKWTDVPTNNEINLIRLGHGNYQLKVRSQAGFGGKYVYASLPFKVMPAWYQTIWFYLFLTVLFALAIWLAVRLRLNSLLKGKKILEQEVANRTASLNETVENYKQINEQYEEVQQQLLDNDHAKEELIGIILHDIWSPLDFIATSSNNMSKFRNKYSQEELFDFLGTLGGSAVEILHLTDELLKWLRSLAGGFKIDAKQINVPEVIGNITRLYKEIASQRGNKIELECTTERIVVTDPTVLTLIVRNIVDNANKNTLNGKISIGCYTDNTTANCTLTIADNGQGIPPEKIALLMEMSGQEPLRQGALGLRFAFGFANLINAKIGISSVVGKGTTVSITIPSATI